MIRLERHAPERELFALRPLPNTEGKATFAASAAVLDLLDVSPEHAARLDLGDVLRLIHEEGA
ncbi:hypothetical protein ROS62_29665 [Streptomyces sp. DSM 41972]|uniref:Uncharacterized protein n=1 Tax=Streptomyces althioticus subsp. attaecolombicae TaxID=3075534 RepID=A0ABU3IAJ3_9ACTN|nr:hypothetical protein [Streptomyces sp. DSM 41972]SCE13006.1 hypothetical protein GA0115238_15609 [Streptomyces sp. di50b]SCE53846.1 hypothetical protein GA0115245_146710 [Streptomyces sp. di188]